MTNISGLFSPINKIKKEELKLHKLEKIGFKVILKTHARVENFLVCIEKVKYNIGLDENRIHHSLQVIVDGKPNGVEIHKDEFKVFKVFNDKLPDHDIEFLKKALEVFIKQHAIESYL